MYDLSYALWYFEKYDLTEGMTPDEIFAAGYQQGQDDAEEG